MIPKIMKSDVGGDGCPCDYNSTFMQSGRPRMTLRILMEQLRPNFQELWGFSVSPKEKRRTIRLLPGAKEGQTDEHKFHSRY
jgi:hypothetical protein